ncbi:MAG: FRG domain-containing protein, partial [Chloroflexota bacterium]
MKEENEFYTKESMACYKKLCERLEDLGRDGRWLYRGQHSRWDLDTTLERYCNLYGYPLTDAPGIEVEMIRNFRRLYSGEDREDVADDTLYCISLMRHYGAPSRLLDFTYSKDVAMYFGIEYAFDNPPVGEDKRPVYDANRSLAIWCINRDY